MFANCLKLTKDTGFKPKYSLVEGLKKTLEEEGIERFKEGIKVSEVEEELLKKLC